MTWHDETENVRVVQSGSPEIAYLQQTERSPAQKLQDQIYESAKADATEALALLVSSLEMLAVGVEVPAKFRGLPVTLGQLVEFVSEQQRLHR